MALMDRWAWVGVLAAGLMAAAGSSEAKIEITGAALVSAQDVDFDSTSGNLDEDFNFNDPRVNLYINGEVSEKISIAVGLWAGNDFSHENTRGVADGTGARRGNEPGIAESIEMLNACIVIKDFLGSGFSLKPGLIDIPYGWEYAKRTNHGDDGNNDFITNGLLDINGTENGISLSGAMDMGHIKSPAAWEIAVMNGGAVVDGNPSGTGGGVRSNNDLAWAVRAEVGVQDNLTVQASFYNSDQTKDGDQDPLGVGGSFFVNNVNLAGPAGVAGTVANPNLNGLVFTNGYDRQMWEVSAKYDYGQGYILGFWGNIDADSSTTGASREWDYLGAQGRYNFDDHSYVAVRWNQLDPDYTASNNLGEPSLWAVAVGYKISDGATAKAEWTSFDEDGDAFGNAAAANTRDGVSSDADALTVSVGVKF